MPLGSLCDASWNNDNTPRNAIKIENVSSKNLFFLQNKLFQKSLRLFNVTLTNWRAFVYQF